ncbi:MAG TPA: serine/threonine-protein kinase [Iamia sp.]|nr:serine/threonine-protein kinase [Iamia sp.]
MQRSAGLDMPPVPGLTLPTALPPAADGHPRWEISRAGERVVLHEGDGRRKRGRERRPFEARLAVLIGLGAVPGLERVLDGGVAGGRPWWTTPLPTSPTDLPIPTSVERAVAVGVDVATALGRLHAAGLIHGRVAPGAVLAVEGGARLAVSPEPPPVPTADDGEPAPAHVPPEVLEGRPWTPAGDMWALASTLFTLLEGAAPYAAEAARGVADVLLAITLGGRSSFVRPDVGPALRRALERGLDPDPERRPSASSFGALLVAATGVALADRLDTVAPPAPAGGPGRPALALDPEAAGDITAVGRPLGSAYLLTEPIGRGGMGRVWRGVRRSDGSAVAVKILRPELADDPDQVARFLTERNALRSVVDPHVVQVHDLVVEGSVLAIVMDLVTGGDLRTHLSATGPLPPAEATTLLAGVATGLAAVHRAGIVHRDVKPENVLLSGGDPPVRLTDFGVARVVDGPQLTRPTQLVGTPDYVAPELAAGRHPAPASDVYALGVLAYEALAGRRPFVGPTPAAVLRAHLDEAPIVPPGIDLALWEVVDRCLAKDPATRPPADAVAARLAELVPALEGRPALDLLPVGAPPAGAAVAPSMPAPEALGAVPVAAPSGRVLDGPAGPDDDRLSTRAGRRPVEPPPPEPDRRRRWPWAAALVAAIVLIGAAGFWTARRDAGPDTDTAATTTMPADLSLRYVALPVTAAALTDEGRAVVEYVPGTAADDDTRMRVQVQATGSDPSDPEVVRSSEFQAVGGRGGASTDDDVVLTLDSDDDGVNDGISFRLPDDAPDSCVLVLFPYEGTEPQPADLGLTTFAPECTRIDP